MFYLFAFRVLIDLFHDTFDLLQFEVDDIVHDALSQRNVFFEQFEIKIGIRFKRIYYIRI